MDAVISNSSLNSYGFRVLTSGIDTSQFLRNPILLWGHHRAWRGTTDEVLPVGRVENLRVEGDSLIGTPVFDPGDDFAVRIKNKFESGFLKMVSAGLDVVETSDDPAHIVSGQRRATVTRSKLREVSIVDIGANDDAIVLYASGERINLRADGNIPAIPAIPETPFKRPLNAVENPANPNPNPSTSTSMKTIALKLGLSETATEAETLARVGELQTEAARVAELQAALDARLAAEIVAEVDSAVALRRITADKKPHFLALGKTAGIDSLRVTLSAIAPAQKPSDLIRGAAGNPGNPAPSGNPALSGDYKTFADVPAAERIRLRAEEPERYIALYRAEYGITPKLD